MAMILCLERISRALCSTRRLLETIQITHGNERACPKRAPSAPPFASVAHHVSKASAFLDEDVFQPPALVWIGFRQQVALEILDILPVRPLFHRRLFYPPMIFRQI